MPRLDKATRAKIKALESDALREIVLKLASKDKSAFDFIMANYVDPEKGALQLFNEAKSDLRIIYYKDYKGFAPQMKLFNMLKAATKRVNEFTKVCNNKLFEANLLMDILYLVFHDFSEVSFGTAFTQLDNKVIIMLKRVINVVKKFDEEQREGYRTSINQYLSVIHKKSSYLDATTKLPKEI